MPASCVQTLGGTAALLVSDGTSSLVTMSQSVSQSGRQNSPPTKRVNQMGALPVTPHQKVKRSVNCWCSSRDAPGEEQGVGNNKHNKCSVSANRQLTHTRSKLGQTAEPLTKWAHMSVSTITYRTDKRQRARAQLHSCVHLLHKVMQRERTMRGQSAFHPDKALRLSSRVSITDHSGRQHISTPQTHTEFLQKDSLNFLTEG